MDDETEAEIEENPSLQSIVIALAGFLMSGGKLTALSDEVLFDLDRAVSIELKDRQGYTH
jgi:hypothetical protein